jgi:hypothetical protein
MSLLARRIGGIAWLILAAALMITGDLVIDLAFEEAALPTSADASSLPETPDNAAEHILMPSQKADSVTATWQVGMSAAFQSTVISFFPPPPLTRRMSPVPERQPRSSPIPLPLPLRI